ncbi:MAG: sugar phosphate isomerase/epimerase family protein [Candidatus Latescibacterota bacterium]|jgi:sugar phosphate isomerase/epimerase
MKIAFMTFSTPQLTLGETLAAAARLGYDGIEPRVGAGHRHGLEYDAPTALRAEAVRRAVDAGVAYACVATSCQFANPATAAGHLEDGRRAIRLAADLSAPCIRVFGGPLAEGAARQDGIGSVAASLAALAEEARTAGVTVCMETHDDWCDPRHVAAVMRQAGQAAIAVNWDVMHPVRTRLASVDESFEILRPWIRHLHVHDGAAEEPLHMVPLGTGMIDTRRAVERLAEVGYDGYLSGEWIDWEPWEVHLPRELAVLRQYVQEAEATPRA